MRTETVRHRYPVDADTFWATYFDREFTESLYLRGLGSSSLDLHELSGTPSDGVRRRLTATPQTAMPRAISKLMGGVQSYTESGFFDPATTTWRYSVEPAALRGRVAIEGTLRTTPAGDEACTVETELRVTARILGVGGVLERFICDQFVEDMGRQEHFLKEWLARDQAG